MHQFRSGYSLLYISQTLLTSLIPDTYRASCDALGFSPRIREMVVEALYLTVARHEQQLFDTQAELSELLIPCPYRDSISGLSP